MKGVILAGGKGTRLLPATRVMNKHMLPIINEPMIVYPLRTLISLGCTDILIVSGGNHIGQIAEYLGDGSEFAVNLTYKVQKAADGIAGALLMSHDFFNGEDVTAILGDNIFEKIEMDAPFDPKVADIFIKEVHDPERFGVYAPGGIEEKPRKPKSPFAVTGLYHYPPSVFHVIRGLRYSARGELEITDVNNYYIQNNTGGAKTDMTCRVHEVKGFWSDAGTPESLVESIAWAHKGYQR